MSNPSTTTVEETEEEETSADTVETAEFTQESALTLIRKQEEKIQKAYKKRTKAPRPLKHAEDDFFYDATMKIFFAFFVIGVILGLAGIASTVNNWPAYAITLIAIGCVATLVSLVLTSGFSILEYNKTIIRRFARKKLAEIKLESDTEHRLWSLKEIEYRKIEMKALAKAQPALDYVNSKMPKTQMVLKQGKFCVINRSLDEYEKAIVEMETAYTESNN